MQREDARNEIRSRISCKQYLERSKSGLYCCPFCGSGKGNNATGALKLYDSNTWTCFACHKSGDVIDLYQQATGADYNTALSLLAQEAGITIDAYRPTAAADFSAAGKTGAREGAQRNEQRQGNTEPLPDANNAQRAAESPTEAAADYSDYYRACRSRLLDPEAGKPGREYLQRRGISPETAAAYFIGYDPAADPAGTPGAMGEQWKPHPCPRITIPCSKGFYTARRIDAGTDYKYSNASADKGAAQPATFNLAALYAQDAQAVFVTEGALSALSIIEAGAPAIALNSANRAGKFIKELQQRTTAATLILCLDNDETGRRATATLAEGLQRLKISFITADICGGQNDPNDALNADRQAFIAAVAQAREDAAEQAAAAREAAQRAEQERQRRTGAGMIDTFLSDIRGRKYEPIPTGIADIDKALSGGFMRQWLVLLGAPPGAGKTALAQWIFEGMAQRGTTCLYINLEMSRDQLLARSISRIAAKNGDKIKHIEVLQGYRWSMEQEEAVLAAADEYRREIAPHMIYNPDEIKSDLDSILQYIEQEAARAKAADLTAPIVVLDYLQVITGGPREDKADLIQRAISSLKQYAIQHETVVFAIMAQNRESNRTGISNMESGRDTSNLEYGADLLLGLDFTRCLKRGGGKAKDELTPEDMNYKTLKIHKGRFSAPGAQVDLFFSGETMTFEQLAPEFAEEYAAAAGPRKTGRRL